MKLKKFINASILIFCICLLFGALGNGKVYAAALGEYLGQPEAGWQRIDDNSTEILYSDSTIESYCDMYEGGQHWIFDKKVFFNFTGSKIRIISYSDNNSYTAKSAIINIDGVEYEYNPAICDRCSYRVITFEKTDLPNKEHFVQMYRKSSEGRFGIDAIDIDKDGELKSYNEIQAPQGIVLDMESEKNKIHLNETVTVGLTIDNIKDIAAEDVRIKYDNTKLQFLGVDEVEGIKLVVSDNKKAGELRFIIASKGEKNIVNDKKILLKLKFKGIAAGEALVDVTKGRISDGIEMEKDLTDEQCGQTTIIIDESVLKDVNNSGEFTLLDLAIDARHMGKDPKSAELAKYNTDIVPNNAIDDADLLEIGKLMLENPNYKF